MPLRIQFAPNGDVVVREQDTYETHLTLPEADACRALLCHAEIVAALKAFTDSNMCHCDDECEKETGADPPTGRNTNAWGEPIWGETCAYCNGRVALKKAEPAPKGE